MPFRQWVRGIIRRSAEDREPSRGERDLRQELDVLAQDLRYNARVIRRAGPLSIAVVLTLSVGLGINAIVFSLFNSLLFRPWATHDPDSFVHVYARPSGCGVPRRMAQARWSRSRTSTGSDPTHARWRP